MLILEVDKRVKGELETIWDILTDTEGFAEVAPDINRVELVSGEAKGMVRRIHHKSGRSWEEECKEWEPHSLFSMQVDTANYPLPVSYMRRITSIEQKQKNIVLKIRYEYTPKYGPLGFFMDKHQVRPILKIFATQLLDNLANKIHQTKQDSMISAATILENKDPAILTITPETLIAEACKILTEKRIGCLIALDTNKKIAGILSERDIVNGIAKAGQPILDKPAKEFMTLNVILCHPENSLADLMSLMSKNRIRHLPVVDDNENLMGVISIGDTITARMGELEQESAAMHQYIEGRKWREVAMQIGRGAASEEFG